MDDSVDELQRSHDRLFPPSSPTKQLSIARGTGAAVFTAHAHDHMSPGIPQGTSFLLETPARAAGGASATSTSPMRIRVTVEAEPSATPIGLDGVDERSVDSQGGTFDSGTTTITIPLKGEDEHKPVKRRGRPRKSLDSTPLASAQDVTPKAVKGTPKPRKNAKGTPAPSRMRQTRSTVKNNNDIPTTRDDSPPVAAADPGQPVAKRTRRQSNVAGAVSTTPQDPVPARARRKPLDFANMTPLHQKKSVVDEMQGREVPDFAAMTPWNEKRAKVAKKIKDRVSTPRKLTAKAQQSLFVGLSPPKTTSPRSRYHSQQQARTNVEQGQVDEEDEHEIDHDEVEEEDNEVDADDVGEGMTGLEDDTSVLDRSAVESEGFSMVSIDSLRDHRKLAEASHSQQPSRLRIEQSVHEPNEEEVIAQQTTASIPRRSRSPARRSAKLPTPAASDVAHEHEVGAQMLRSRPSPRRHQLDIADQSSFEKTHSKCFNNDTQAPITPATSSHDEHSELSRTQLFEQQIQREREEVIKQAEAANKSQVVVIEDTTMVDVEDVQEQSEMYDQSAHDNVNKQPGVSPQHNKSRNGDSGIGVAEQAEDMWLDEADRSIESSMLSRPSRRHLKRKQEAQVEVAKAGSLTRNLEELFTGDDGPRRAKIPRTWRRVSGTGFLYSDEVASPAKEAPAQAVERSQLHIVPEATADVWFDMPPAERADGRAARAKRARGTQVRRSPQHLAASPKRTNAVADAAAKDKSMANEQYFSESEERDAGEHAEEASTFEAPGYETYMHDEEIIHQSIEEDDYVDNSHARQLRQELIATTPGRKQSRKPQEEMTAAVTRSSQLQHNDNRSQLLLRKPGKVYAPLFEAMSHAQPPVPSSPPRLPPASAIPPSLATIPSFSTSVPSEETGPKPTLLSRLTSWFFPAPQPSLVPSPTSSIPWNRNHYLLLDHYYKLIVHRPDKPVPSAYMVSWNTIPHSLRRLLGEQFVTFADTDGQRRRKREKWPAVVTEEWVRIARCFVEEARIKGVPVLCDGRMDPKAGERIRRARRERRRRALAGLEPVEEEEEEEEVEGEEWKDDVGNGFPVRDVATGRVKRIKQDWRGEAEAEEVLKRVYSLWVLEMMRGEGEVVPEMIGVERYA